MPTTLAHCAVGLWRRCRADLLLSSGVLLLSCASGPRPPSVQDTLLQLREDLDATRIELATMKQSFEDDRRIRISEKYCKDGTVARFMEALRRSPLNACGEVDADNALNFMHTQRWVFAWMRPGVGIGALVLTRAGAIRRNLKLELMHPTTQILVMVKPHADTEEAHHAATLVGNAIRDKIKELLPDELRQTQVMPTYHLPCTLQRSRGKLKRYRDADGNLYSENLPGEPSKNEPRVAVWIFFTDC